MSLSVRFVGSFSKDRSLFEISCAVFLSMTSRLDKIKIDSVELRSGPVAADPRHGGSIIWSGSVGDFVASLSGHADPTRSEWISASLVSRRLFPTGSQKHHRIAAAEVRETQEYLMLLSHLSKWGPRQMLGCPEVYYSIDQGRLLQPRFTSELFEGNVSMAISEVSAICESKPEVLFGQGQCYSGRADSSFLVFAPRPADVIRHIGGSVDVRGCDDHELLLIELIDECRHVGFVQTSAGIIVYNKTEFASGSLLELGNNIRRSVLSL